MQAVYFLKSLPLKRDYLIFLGFLALSSLFWLLKTFEKTYEADYTFNIDFHDKKGYVFDEDLPKKVTLTVEETGFDLLRYKLNPNFQTVSLNLEELIQRRERRRGTGNYFLLSSDIKGPIIRYLPSTTTIKNIQPDTLHIRFGRQVQKKVPVSFNGLVIPARQRMISGNIRVTPDSVTIFGSARILDTLLSVRTEFETFNNVKDTLSQTMRLQKIPGIEFGQNRFNVMIPVETFTEKTVNVPVVGIGFPNDMQVRTFPGLVQVSFFVGVGRYSTVDERNFKAWVDYSDIKNTGGNQLKVTVETDQKWIDNMNVSPEMIDFLLEIN
jgi:hypothetical protein